MPRAQLARPAIVSHVTTALGFGLLAVIPVSPVQEMALFGAVGELFSGLHVLFVMPLFLRWLGAMDELRQRRPLFGGERRLGVALAALAGAFARLQRIRSASSCPSPPCRSPRCGSSRRSYDSTYLHMIDAAERLRVDYERFDAASCPARN